MIPVYFWYFLPLQSASYFTGMSWSFEHVRHQVIILFLKLGMCMLPVSEWGEVSFLQGTIFSPQTGRTEISHCTANWNLFTKRSAYLLASYFLFREFSYMHYFLFMTLVNLHMSELGKSQVQLVYQFSGASLTKH